MNTENNSKNKPFKLPYIAFFYIIANVNAAVYLQRLCYWYTKMKRKRDGGWFYKSRKELENETGLTTSQQRTALKLLTEQNLVECCVKGSPPTTWFKINSNKINPLLKEWQQNNTQVIESRQFATSDKSICHQRQIHNSVYTQCSLRENTSYFLHAEREAQNPLAAENKIPSITEPVMSTEFESLVAALSPAQPIVDSKPKPSKLVRQRSPKQQVMIAAKQAPEGFNDDQAQAYRDWVQHAGAKKISSAAMQAQKDLLTTLHQEGYDIIKIINHYLLLDVHRLKEDDIRQAFKRKKPQATSNVIPLQQAKRREPTMGWV